jgi:hypothetical protein
MIRLVAILVTLSLVATPAKADVALWPEQVSGWTVIQVYGDIKRDDFATFERYTVWADPAATLVIVTGPGGSLLGWYQHGYTRSPEETDRRSNGHLHVGMCPDMDRRRNRPKIPLSTPTRFTVHIALLPLILDYVGSSVWSRKRIGRQVPHLSRL